MVKNVFLFFILSFFIVGCSTYQVSFDVKKMRYYDSHNYTVFLNDVLCTVSDLSYLDSSIIMKSTVDKRNKVLKISTNNNQLIKGQEIADKLNFKFDLVILNGVPASVDRFINSFYLKNSIKIVKRISKDTIQPKVHRYLENDVLWFEYDY